MIGLFDRDVFLKLGCCALWEMAIDAIEITQPFRLESTSNASSNRKIISRMLAGIDPEDTIDRIAEMIQKIPVLDENLVAGLEASDEFQSLGDIADIDSGERILAAVVMRKRQERFLISGDKRFIQAFRDALPEAWLDVGSSFISFEMCLLAIHERFGFQAILDRAYAVRCCDGSLRLALGDNPSSDLFRDALLSFDPCRQR